MKMERDGLGLIKATIYTMIFAVFTQSQKKARKTYSVSALSSYNMTCLSGPVKP